MVYKEKKEEQQEMLIKPSRAFKHLPRNSVERDRKRAEKRGRRWEDDEEADNF